MSENPPNETPNPYELQKKLALGCSIDQPERPKLTRRPEEPPAPAWTEATANILKSQPGRVRAALTGGVGSGKSTVAELLVAFGADLIDFDLLSRKVLEPDTPGFYQTVELLGPKIVTKDGTLDRQKIALTIFKKPLIKKALEDIVHPLAWDLMVDRLTALTDSPLVIIDTPLLFEANLNPLFYPVIVTFASVDAQYQRLRSRDPHKSRRLLKSVIKSQKPFAEKVRLADIVINNGGSLISLIRQTKEVYLTLMDWKTFK
ncbi:MAG: dephospho-CoA kinase [Deltaproteobacteria bacterium]|jgi:dephospho-CoA kinase|nr:dephospho-CoA kinase [Deltaproteobacteria bacterium]